MEPYSVLIVDDHPLMRQALTNLIEDENDFIVAGEAQNGRQALEKAAQNHPDIIVMDVFMPVLDGISATIELRKIYPSMRILALTSSLEEETVLEVIKAGAAGYILKDALPAEIMNALRQVAAGGEYWPSNLALRLVKGFRISDRLKQLSPREHEVIKLVGEGRSNMQIAQQLVISEATVSAHVSHILKKLNLENRTQAALLMKNSFG